MEDIFIKTGNNFAIIAGSLLETKTWLKKADSRKLISDTEYEDIIQQLKELHLKLNVFIKKLKQNTST